MNSFRIRARERERFPPRLRNLIEHSGSAKSAVVFYVW